MVKTPWKSGSLVKFVAGGGMLMVVGYDSVGSVICERVEYPERERFYVPPGLLINAGPNSEACSY